MTDWHPKLKENTHTEVNHWLDSVGANQSNVDILDYFRPSADIERDKEASRSIVHSEFSGFCRNWMF